MLTEKDLYQEYDQYKRLAILKLKQGQWRDGFSLMNLLCVLARQYYLAWTIPEFEDLLYGISKEEIGIRKEKFAKQVKKRIVFYDTQATDNYVLSQQYLAAITSWNVELLYLTTKDVNDPQRKMIKSFLESHDGITVCKISEQLNELERARAIVNKIIEFEPEKCFIQTHSFDVAGVIAFGALENIETYFIETSDHILWLGTKAFDYYINFRSLGYNTCVQHRNIAKEKLLMQPFYPITYGKPYQGIPYINKASIKILSGARLEKIYGAENQYFRMVSTLLKTHPEIEFYYIGAGVYGKLAQTGYLEQIIREFELGQRFHVLGYRSDIVELMDHMDIYMGTYPIGGGLMTQIAASQGIPILQFVSEGLSSSVGEFIDCTNRDQSFVFKEEDLFYEEAKKLIENSGYRKQQGENLKKAILTEEQFNKQLFELIFEGRSHYVPSYYKTDCSKNRENQIEVENFCTHDHSRIIVKNQYVRKKEPIKYLLNCIDFLIHVDKKWLLKKIYGK